jgi:hypothetical protein
MAEVAENVIHFPAQDHAMAEAFLKQFDDDTILFNQHPDKGGPFPRLGATALKTALDGRKWGYSAYFGVNTVKPGVNKKPTKDDIETIRAVFGDIDWDRAAFAGRFEEGLRALRKRVKRTMRGTPPYPSILIRTGGGFQPLWLIEPLPNTPENRERAERVGDFIAHRFGGDPVGNVDRYLRLPGSVNFPKREKREAGQPVALATWTAGTGKRYRLEELEEAWAEGIAARQVEAKTRRPGGARARANAEHYDVNDDLSGGMKEREAGRGLAECRWRLKRLAAIAGGPLSERDGWVNPTTGVRTSFGRLRMLFALRAIADDDPTLEGQCWDLLVEIRTAVGHDMDGIDKQWNAAAGKAAQRLAAGKDVATVGTVVQMYVDTEPMITGGWPAYGAYSWETVATPTGASGAGAGARSRGDVELAVVKAQAKDAYRLGRAVSPEKALERLAKFCSLVTSGDIRRALAATVVRILANDCWHFDVVCDAASFLGLEPHQAAKLACWAMQKTAEENSARMKRA